MKIISGVVSSIIKNISVVIFVLLWELGSRTGFINPNFVAAPSAIFKTVFELYRTGVLFDHLLTSLQRAVLGFLLAAVAGIPLGFMLGGWFKTFERIVNPVLRLLGQFNPFSLFPVFMLLFGIGELSKVVMIFWVSLWPVMFNTINGFKEVDPILIKSTRSLGANRLILFSKVLLPSAAPYIFTGLKMASGTAFFMLIAAEMIGASKGLGWLVLNAQVNYMIPRLFAATILICTLGLLLNKSIKLLEKKVVNWKDAAYH